MPGRIYYFANQIYQFGHALPLYNAAGGVFILKKLKRVIEFRKHVKGIPLYHDEKSFLNTPRFIVKNVKSATDLEGVIISLSNSAIHRDPDRCRTIYIGHGMGDKKFGEGDNGRLLESYDYHFISGPKHLEKLKDSGVDIPESRRVEIGNLRFDGYVNRSGERARILASRGIADTGRKNILFAPTWKWGAGTLQRYGRIFAGELTKEYNVIIRPHSHDRKYIPGLRRWASRKGVENLYFSDSTDLARYDVMDDFIISDLMISDTSSILYEYLITKKPIIVARNDFSDLHAMPDRMNVMKYVSIYDEGMDIGKLVSESLSDPGSEARYGELLHNCFSFNDGRSVERAVAFIESILRPGL